MIRVRMSDDGLVDWLPGVDVKVTRVAIQSFRVELKDVVHGLSSLYGLENEYATK
jgi:hypothetical protein